MKLYTEIGIFLCEWQQRDNHFEYISQSSILQSLNKTAQFVHIPTCIILLYIHKSTNTYHMMGPSYIYYYIGHYIGCYVAGELCGMGCTILLISKHPIFYVGGHFISTSAKSGYFICGEHASILINVV